MAKDIYAEDKRFTVNPEPWSEVRPRLLGYGRRECRFVLVTAAHAMNDHVVAERKRTAALGEPAWDAELDSSTLSDNLNLDLDPWLFDRVNADDLDAVIIEDGKHSMIVEARDFPAGRYFRSRPLGAVLRRAPETSGLTALGECWVLISKDDDRADNRDAYRVRVDLVYRLLGGDPSVRLRLVPRKGASDHPEETPCNSPTHCTVHGNRHIPPQGGSR